MSRRYLNAARAVKPARQRRSALVFCDGTGRLFLPRFCRHEE
jgi:hypothetical protein